MNDDLIKRSDAIAEIRKARTPDVASYQYAELFINAVRRAPSADRPINGVLFKGRLEEGDYNLIKSTDGWVLKGETSYVGFNFADRPSVDKEYLTKLIQEAVYDGEACARLLDLVDKSQGEWIDTKGGWRCTACNKWANCASDFCPSCGARMKGV